MKLLKHIFVSILLFSGVITAFPQQIEPIVATLDSTSTKPFELIDDFERFDEKDSLLLELMKVDSLLSPLSEKEKADAAKPVIDSPIDYNSQDSMAFSFENGQQIVHLYGGATIKYGTINLEADYISMNFQDKEIYASVMRDSLGGFTARTKFTEGSEEFECESLRYNFVTGKGFVENVVTEQQDGIVRGAKAKMVNKDIFCMVDGKYSTCNADHPHFYLQMTKGKIVREKAIITGRSYLVLEDFPIYFPFLPYGYIPTNNKSYSSGVIIPSYGEENTYGFYLREGGFYWAASDYFDLKVTGDIYSKGKWGLNATTNYRKRYKYSGSFGFSYSRSVTGTRGINQNVSPNFSVRLSHRQDAKANPSQTISASVDFSTSGFNRENEFDNPDKYLSNSTSSTVSYRKDFLNTPFSVSANLRASQNTRDSTVSLSFPSLNINMKTIQPFKPKKRVGKKQYWEDFKLQYSSQFESKITAKESMLLSTPYSAWQKGIKHNLPITLTPFKLLNHINFVPSIQHSQRWYFDYVDKYWMDGYEVVDNETGMQKWIPGHVEEVRVDRFSINYDYSVGLSSSATLYGMYTMINPNWRLKAIRHKIDPSIGFSYRPDFSNKRFGFYDWVQVDSLGNYQQFNRFQNGMYGSASAGESGSVNFSLNNNIEMKLANKDTTTTEKFKKVAIFDNLSFSSSYNLAAESFHLSPFALNARTKIAGTSINITGTLDPYALDEKGKRIDEYMWKRATGIARLGRLTNISTGYSLNYSSDKLKKMIEERRKLKSGETGLENKGETDGDKKLDAKNESIKYEPFSMPWQISLNYTFKYNNNDGRPHWVQAVGMNGSLALSPKWNANFTSGFDIVSMKLTHTSVGIVRDLHCWTMSFDFSPIGSRPYYSFTIRANASMLKDLKVERREF